MSCAPIPEDASADPEPFADDDFWEQMEAMHDHISDLLSAAPPSPPRSPRAAGGYRPFGYSPEEPGVFPGLSSTRPNDEPGGSAGALCAVQESDAEAFVRDMHAKGCLNWALYRRAPYGALRVVNLEDETDVADISDAELAKLYEQAFSGSGSSSGHAGPPVPLQPWEVEKLKMAAQQVMAALEDGRYCRDFGSALLGHLRGWQGAEDWARAEEARIASLVDGDDSRSREELRRWIEESLLSTLREVQKDANRGFMAGDACSSGLGHSVGRHSAARTGAAPGSKASDSMSDAARLDKFEEQQLQQALHVSAEQGGDCGLADSAPLWAFEDGPEEATYEKTEADAVVVGAGEGNLGLPRHGKASGAVEGGHVAAGDDGPRHPEAVCSGVRSHRAAEGCGHGCDLHGTCCRCIGRSPSASTLQGLRVWLRQQRRGTEVVESPGCFWRFYCASCAAASAHAGSAAQGSACRAGGELTLPFGGILVQEARALSPEQQHVRQHVQLTATALATLSQGSGGGVPAALPVALGAALSPRSLGSSSWILVADNLSSTSSVPPSVAVEDAAEDRRSDGSSDVGSWVIAELESKAENLSATEDGSVGGGGASASSPPLPAANTAVAKCDPPAQAGRMPVVQASCGQCLECNMVFGEGVAHELQGVCPECEGPLDVMEAPRVAIESGRAVQWQQALESEVLSLLTSQPVEPGAGTAASPAIVAAAAATPSRATRADSATARERVLSEVKDRLQKARKRIEKAEEEEEEEEEEEAQLTSASSAGSVAVAAPGGVEEAAEAGLDAQLLHEVNACLKALVRREVEAEFQELAADAGAADSARPPCESGRGPISAAAAAAPGPLEEEDFASLAIQGVIDRTAEFHHMIAEEAASTGFAAPAGLRRRPVAAASKAVAAPPPSSLGYLD